MNMSLFTNASRTVTGQIGRKGKGKGREGVKKKTKVGGLEKDESTNLLNRCWDVTCKQGYVKITHRNGRTSKGQIFNTR
jgi:hypothetical protein